MNDKHYDITVSEKEGPVLKYEAKEITEYQFMQSDLMSALEEKEQKQRNHNAEDNSYFNGSHYLDRTAHDAIKHIDDQEAYAEMRYKTFLKTIFNICKLSGFYIENRIELKDLKTGKTWR